jgi:hypothetical protein
MPGWYPKLERLALWCRRASGLVLILGCCGFSVWMITQAAQGHRWNAVVLWAAIGVLILIVGLLEVLETRKPRLSLTGTFIFLGFSLTWLACALYLCWRWGFQFWTGNVLLAGGSVFSAAVFVYRQYRAPAKGDAAPLGFWWWIDRKLR